jgi:cellulose synthase/poly-beta-1,6-N-acetylglucosamine synthase-like glycosyltransferase
VDDHHSLQMSWRTQRIDFVNFTGTAGVWRAEAIESAGGWRSARLAEDCELSIRVLFAGWRTRFTRELAVPAELPQTLAAYRLQQKRWTQGWAQLQRWHLLPLWTRYRTGWAPRLFSPS